MKGLIIRPYKNADYSSVVQIYKEGGLYYKFADARKRLTEKVKRDPGSIIVAVLNKEVIGTVSFMEDGRMAFIFRLGVGEKHRKRGIGHKLMEEAEKQLRSRGVERVFILVNEEKEELHGYYKKRGYNEGGHYRWLYKNLVKL